MLSKAEHAKAVDKAVFPMMQGGPLMHGVAAKAVALKEAASPDYQEYAAQVIRNAQALCEGLAEHGMRPTSGGTDTHLALIDLQPLGVTGAQAEERCDEARITLNKNAIPFDPQLVSRSSCGVSRPPPYGRLDRERQGEPRPPHQPSSASLREDQSTRWFATDTRENVP